MNRKHLSILVLLIVVIAGFACGKGGFSDYKSALSDLVDAKTRYISDLQRASKAEDVVSSTKAYITKLTAFKTRRDAIFAANPHLTDNIAMPANIASLLDRSSKLEDDIDKAIAPAVERFPNDANVMAAWDELNTKRSGI